MVHLASVGGHTETLKVLIEKTPQLNLQDQVANMSTPGLPIVDRGSHDLLN